MAAFLKPGLRIMMLLSSFKTGGMEIQALSLACALAQKGFNPIMAALQGEGPMRDIMTAKGLKCLDLSKREGIDPGLPWRLSRLYRQNSVDLVHAHNWNAGFYAACSRWFKNIPVVTTLHGLAHQAPSRKMLLRGFAARFQQPYGLRGRPDTSAGFETPPPEPEQG